MDGRDLEDVSSVQGWSDQMALIIGRSDGFKDIPIGIPPGGLTLGREKSGLGRLSIDRDSDVSREHCTVQYDGNAKGFIVTDLGSRNGTFLLPGEQRLKAHEPMRCSAGQLLRVGPHSVFELTGEEAIGAPTLDRPLQALSASNAASQREALGGPTPSATIAGAVKTPELPRLAEDQRLDLAAIRVPYERFYLVFVWMPTVFAGITLAIVALAMPVRTWILFAGIAAAMVLLGWLGWKLFLVRLLGDAIRVSSTQYPQIDTLVTGASAILGIRAPTVFILQGHGLFEILVARRFSRRGVLIITSTMLDDLTKTGSSRELMFFIGRQLGLIATGYFDLWFFKHTLGQFATLLYLAWKRRCQMTADRLGLLVAGELLAAEQALLVITAGSGIAANTNLQALKEQQNELFQSFWAWILLGLSGYPYMVNRIVLLREFAAEAARRRIEANSPVAIGALPIYHHAIRAVPLMIVHGHDHSGLLELETFLRRKFPHVEPVLMIDETTAANTLPEKFERLARGVKGALVLLTPDDLAMAQKDRVTRARARQNVIIEIGWIWARLGRQKLLLLTRGELEMPSDLQGVEIHRYAASPVECSEVVRDFIASIEMA
jgi:hypothetical protein